MLSTGSFFNRGTFHVIKQKGSADKGAVPVLVQAVSAHPAAQQSLQLPWASLPFGPPACGFWDPFQEAGHAAGVSEPTK